MKVSVSQGNPTPAYFQVKDVSDLEDLLEVKKTHEMSTIIFKKNHRRIENFESAELLKFDIDGTLAIDKCIQRLKGMGLAYGIITSKSYADNAPPRYHVFIPLVKTITDASEYKSAINNLLSHFPEADQNAKDAARFFSASKETAKTWVGVGAGFDHTQRLLLISEGGRNTSLYKIACGMRGEGMSDDQLLKALLIKNQTMCNPPLPESEVETIAVQACMHEQGSRDDLGLMTADEVLESTETIEWLVDGLLTRGGVSIIAAAPKTGKSTLTRQLAKSVLYGAQFLGRETERGSVVYFALEEQTAMLKEHYSTIGLKGKNFLVRTEGIPGDAALYVEQVVEAKKPDLVVFDTMNLVTKMNNLNDYVEVTRQLAVYRDIARKHGTHFLFVFHTNKSFEAKCTDKVMGSTGIRGAVDCTMVMEHHPSVANQRILVSEQRGGERFDNQQISYDNVSQTYTAVNTKPKSEEVKEILREQGF